MRQKLRTASGEGPLFFARGGRLALARAQTLGAKNALVASVWLRLLALCVLVSVSACAPELGDGCERTQQCSVNLDRTCDLSQPGGYCTVPDCEADTCPEDGRCIRFQPDEPRLARSWCMAECERSGDCRDKYVCRNADELNREPGNEDEVAPLQSVRVAESLDAKKSRRFCVGEKD